jgi:hypothetical protein
MRVAVCLSGQPRSYKIGYEYIKKNILDTANVDVFCHTTWNSEKDEFPNLNIYKPKALLVEEPLNPDLSKYTRVPPPQPNWKVKNPALATYSQLYSIHKANELKCSYEERHNFVYDWVIRIRYDFAINAKIPFDKLDNSKLYVPNCRMTPNRDFGNDQFAFSSSNNMNKYSKTFINIDKFYDKGTIMIGEEMMSANWKENNLIGENLLYVDINHPFPPGQYNGTPHSLIREDMEEWQK